MTPRPLDPSGPSDVPEELLFEGLEPSRRARARRRPLSPVHLGTGLVRRVAYWSPVALPLALLAQVVHGGLGPAREEARRLHRAEAVLTERLAGAESQRAEYELRLRAYRDPVYLERERRLMAARSATAAAARDVDPLPTRPAGD